MISHSGYKNFGPLSMEENTNTIFQQVMDQCSGCGICAEDCTHMQSRDGNYPGSIAQALLNGNLQENTVDYILKCSLCGLCEQLCPEEVVVTQMVQAARSHFIDTGFTNAEKYRLLWVDYDWNNFSLYRRSYCLGDAYRDLLKNSCEVMFFPGCTLANESPDLVRAACQWLGDQGQSIGAVLHCCGAPLFQIGLEQRARTYAARLWRKIETAGVRRVVTACPTCQHHLMATRPENGIDIVSIYQLMAEAGLKATGFGKGAVTVHDSCTDRCGRIGQHVRQLLGDYELKEMAHSGKNTICCGSGGIVSAVDPELCRQRANKRIVEIEQVGARICVTYCMSCAHRLANQTEQNTIRHILELVLHQLVDHQGFDRKRQLMWEGDSGDENAMLLKQSKLDEF